MTVWLHGWLPWSLHTLFMWAKQKRCAQHTLVMHHPAVEGIVWFHKGDIPLSLKKLRVTDALLPQGTSVDLHRDQGEDQQTEDGHHYHFQQHLDGTKHCIHNRTQTWKIKRRMLMVATYYHLCMVHVCTCLNTQTGTWVQVKLTPLKGVWTLHINVGIQSWKGVWTLHINVVNQSWKGVWTLHINAVNQSWKGVWTLHINAVNQSWKGVWTLHINVVNQSWKGVWTLHINVVNQTWKHLKMR